MHFNEGARNQQKLCDRRGRKGEDLQGRPCSRHENEIVYPAQDSRTLTMVPWLAEHPYIGNIWEYPNPPPPPPSPGMGVAWTPCTVCTMTQELLYKAYYVFWQCFIVQFCRRKARGRCHWRIFTCELLWCSCGRFHAHKLVIAHKLQDFTTDIAFFMLSSCRPFMHGACAPLTRFWEVLQIHPWLSNHATVHTSRKRQCDGSKEACWSCLHHSRKCWWQEDNPPVISINQAMVWRYIQWIPYTIIDTYRISSNNSVGRLFLYS